MKIKMTILLLLFSALGYGQYSIRVDSTKVVLFNDTLTAGKMASKYYVTTSTPVLDSTVWVKFNDTLTNGGKIATKYALTQLSGGSATWTSISGRYLTTTTCKVKGTQADADKMRGSLFTCLSSTNAGRFGHIANSVYASDSITLTVYCTSNLASGDKSFYYTSSIKDREFERRITVPGECIADASYPQGMWFQGNANDTLLTFDVSAWVLTAASGSGAACAFNIYHGSTNIFSSAIDLGSATSSLNNQPTAVTAIPPSTNITMRITSSAGATNKASDFQVRFFCIPSRIFYGK